NAINPLLSKSEEKTEVTSDTGTTSIFIRDIYNENDTMNVVSHFFKQAEVKEGKYVLDQFEDISTLIYDSLGVISGLMYVYLTSEVLDLIYYENIESSLSI